MKQALILGCSHAYGSEMFPYSKDPRNHSYPAIIAKELGYEINNLSIPGGSNDAMFRIYEEYKQPVDLVIACWSGCNRSETWHDDTKQWQILVPGLDPKKEKIKDTEFLEYRKQWIMFHTDDRVGRLNKIKNILAVNSLATQPVINIDSFWSIPELVWPKNIYWPIDTTFYNWCFENNYPHTDRGHFFEPAHRAFAEFVLKNINLP
jgi:hypothetical protein